MFTLVHHRWASALFFSRKRPHFLGVSRPISRPSALSPRSSLCMSIPSFLLSFGQLWDLLTTCHTIFHACQVCVFLPTSHATLHCYLCSCPIYSCFVLRFHLRRTQNHLVHYLLRLSTLEVLYIFYTILQTILNHLSYPSFWPIFLLPYWRVPHPIHR